ncbi:MAG: hypothetical protein QHI48_08295 [Bacteroidota bacterium]|nr:hypothetical protein [Bacteroidota bacterium]
MCEAFPTPACWARRLPELADGGVWISADRVFAFIAVDGIRCVGYHGMQPASRNAIVFSGESASFRLDIEKEGGERIPVSFDEVTWHPSCTHVQFGGCLFRIEAEGRAIAFSAVSETPDDRIIRVTWDPSSRFLDVHGERSWDSPRRVEGELLLACRDTIAFDEWIRCTGPYAGDFLIPEPWRRMVFRRRVRSGRAGPADLRPEWERTGMVLHDSRLFVLLGGEGFTLQEVQGGWEWTARLGSGGHAVFFVRFFDRDPSVPRAGIASCEVFPPRPAEKLSVDVPRLRLPGFPAVEEFFASVPALVESCRISDAGIVRANAGAYYWAWAWDALVTAMEFPRWGNLPHMAEVIAFVNAHRDENGTIPARWTHEFLPLDTPPAGALEFLFLRLVCEYHAHTGDLQPLLSSWPFCVRTFETVSRLIDERGLFPSEGFYPDYPDRFGRTQHSATAMDIAAHYGFCRDLATCARILGCETIAHRADETAERIARNFADVFWDEQAGFFVDSIELDTGRVHESRPLFTLLFLQRPDSIDLIADRFDRAADFAARRFLTEHGVAMLPPDDPRRCSEPATASWYPHWDLYAVRLWRAAGDADALLRWLSLVSKTYTMLGYCPEFLSLPAFEAGAGDRWKQHGAASNLNGATAWYRALIEGLVGLRLDDGRMRIAPLDLPLEGIRIEGLVHRGTLWDVAVRRRGASYAGLRIDGRHYPCALEVPASFFDGSVHSLEILYR